MIGRRLTFRLHVRECLFTMPAARCVRKDKAHTEAAHGANAPDLARGLQNIKSAISDIATAQEAARRDRTEIHYPAPEPVSHREMRARRQLGG